jgi:hypothetical protein
VSKNGKIPTTGGSILLDVLTLKEIGAKIKYRSKIILHRKQKVGMGLGRCFLIRKYQR